MTSFLDNYRKIYILGIGGSGMSSIAKYLSQRGMKVEGYDQRASYITSLLNNDNITVDFDINEKVYSEDTLFIVSSAVNIKETFLANFIDAKNILTRPHFLQLLSEETKIIGITGTHGKTSTTALLAHIFNFNNVDVSYIYGGLTTFYGIGGHFGDSNLPLILETDEAFNTFEKIIIENLFVTNIDNDHLDHFGTYENLIDAFSSVIRKVNNKCVLNLDNKELNKIFDKQNLSVSSKFQSDYKITFPASFTHMEKSYNVESKLMGEHFISNIVGAVALAKLSGIEINDSLEAVKHFNGVKRRTEFIGEYNGVQFYDDYGHHPTEILATTKALKSITEGNLLVIFQPHRYSRTKSSFKEIKASFTYADLTIVTDIYSAGEKPIPGVSSANFESEDITYIKSQRLVPQYVKNYIKKGDKVLTLGAGDITLLGPQILQYLNE